MSTAWMSEFALAGGIGFGLGGACMMQALRRLGSPHALLAVESITAVIAGFLSWVVLDDKLAPMQIIFCALILSGVLIAGSSWIHDMETQSRSRSIQGYCFAGAASVFQAISLVISRHAFLEAKELGVGISSLDAAFVRMIGGFAIALILLIFVATRNPNHKHPRGPIIGDLLQRQKPLREQPWVWITLNALLGPVLGVTCWLWAVSLLNPGIVQSIAATAPILAIPISRFLESNPIEKRFFIGAPIAILGITALMIC